jgi:MerR family transcriptional regulator, copper efflux regulator
MPNLGIGQPARCAGVAIDTVRYYESKGLRAPAGRLASGYRRNGGAELMRLRFIRRAKARGFSLEDIPERIGDGLRKLVAACPGHGRAEACPILNALTQDGAP